MGTASAINFVLPLAVGGAVGLGVFGSQAHGIHTDVAAPKRGESYMGLGALAMPLSVGLGVAGLLLLSGASRGATASRAVEAIGAALLGTGATIGIAGAGSFLAGSGMELHRWVTE